MARSTTDTFYNQSGSVDAHIMAAMDGTGDFAGASDTVRYQGIAKLTANMGMVAYTIHELNSAIAKADAGNVDNDSGAPHNWDEGWAFFHGPEDDWSCSPAYTMKKRAADYGTETNGVSNALTATTNVVSGLAALQAQDSAGYTAATNTRNHYLLPSDSKVRFEDGHNESSAKYQVEGYAFWKTIEAYAAPHTTMHVTTWEQTLWDGLDLAMLQHATHTFGPTVLNLQMLTQPTTHVTTL